MAEDSKADDMVALVSMEGEKFETPLRVAQMSELVKTMTEDDGKLIDYASGVIAYGACMGP